MLGVRSHTNYKKLSHRKAYTKVANLTTNEVVATFGKCFGWGHFRKKNEHRFELGNRVSSFAENRVSEDGDKKKTFNTFL